MSCSTETVKRFGFIFIKKNTDIICHCKIIAGLSLRTYDLSTVGTNPKILFTIYRNNKNVYILISYCIFISETQDMIVKACTKPLDNANFYDLRLKFINK